LVAIGGVAVVNRLAYFFLQKRGDWIAAAARQIAGQPDSHRVGCGPEKCAPEGLT
jgi:hypothetical protein